ncbi:DUF3152 domain-containing protein [Embleya sp. NBC_00896]|uniref:DUF3152 domain-containing protein n=1 Tax=Embleya sp. NBC_00896 TaxID=2975961 RepID=UPI003868C36F|nr:DUF3152 domain-containing protein [Embleya sp. NBC_00896]
MQYGTDGLPEEGPSGAYASVPQQVAYGQAQDGGYGGGYGGEWTGADTSYGLTGYPEQDTGHHAYPTDTGYVDAGYGGYATQQHTGTQTYVDPQQGWEHPAPEASSGMWVVPGTMPGEPAHWDDPLEPYGAQNGFAGYAADGYSTDTRVPDTFVPDTYAPDSYVPDAYGTAGHAAVGYPSDSYDPYAADAYASGVHAIVEAPAAPMYDTTTFEPQSFVGYGYDTSGAYPIVAPAEDPLVDALYDPPTEHVPDDGPGIGQYAMEPEPWVVPVSDVELEQLSFAGEPTDDYEEFESAAVPEPEQAFGFEPDADRLGPPQGRANTRRANRPPPRKGRRTLVAAGGVVVTGAVLAGAVVLQMPEDNSSSQAAGDDQAAAGDRVQRTDQPSASRDHEREAVQQPGGASSVPMPTPNSPTTTDQLTLRFPLDPKLGLSGDFTTVPGKQAAAGAGKKYTYAVEIENGLQLDGELFATTVQKTLNDPRSWASDGLTFERTDTTKADFVVRLASPGTVHKICSPIVGDTSADNVSCDAYGQKWVMINAWRWAQGSTAYGDDIVGYRQMLINHEVGHRIGHRHETACGAGSIGSDLAPVMMQQTKTRVASTGAMKGEECVANPWPHPRNKAS